MQGTINITSRSEYCYRILNITNLVNYKNFLFVGLPDFSSDDKFKIRWNDSTNIANIDKIRYLQGHQRLVYWYNVTPKRFGKFNINTVIRTNQYSDFESYRTILVPEKSKPNLKVVSVIDKNEITQYDLVSIKYYITCIDDSTISKDWNISISLEESDKGYMIKESPTKNELKRTIEKDQTISPNWTIIYPNVGKYKVVSRY